jgi:ADP-ribose pyrophosphatase YjhB (NUDIX family)
MKKPFSSQEFKKIYSQVPRLTVDLLIKTDKEILLVKRGIEPYKDQWHLPGGTVLYKESLDATISRIAHDELGVAVNNEGLIGYITYNSEELERGFGYTIGLVFQCTIQKGEIKLNDEGLKFGYFTTLPEVTVTEQKTFLLKISQNS